MRLERQNNKSSRHRNKQGRRQVQQCGVDNTGVGVWGRGFPSTLPRSGLEFGRAREKMKFSFYNDVFWRIFERACQ